MTDEGLEGVGVHVANDGPEPLAARLRVALYRDGEQPVGEATEVELALAGPRQPLAATWRRRSAASPTPPGPTASARRRRT